MAKLDDLYSETETTATCWVGRGERVGQLLASSRHEDSRGNATYFGSFNYDGGTGTLTLGDVQLGMPGRIIVGRVTPTAQGIVLDGAGGKISLGGRLAGSGTVTLYNRFGTVVGLLDAEEATIKAGGGDTPGALVVYSPRDAGQGQIQPWPSFFYDGETATLRIGEVQVGTMPGKIVIGPVGSDEQAILLDGTGGHVTLGGRQAGNGSLTVKNLYSTAVGVLDAESATLTLGPSGTTVSPTRDKDGKIVLRSAGGADTVILDGEHGNLTLGGGGADGDVILRNAGGADTVVLDGDNGNLTLGGGGADGDVILRNAGGADTVVLDGDNGNVTLGGGGADGDVILRTATGADAIVMSGSDSELTLGGDGTSGDLIVRNASGEATIELDGGNGTLTLGGPGVNGDIFLRNDNDIETIKIFGSIGDIEFLNADLAEEFEVGGGASAVPGTVMVLTADGTLDACARAYDTRVVGVVAGAGDNRPGIVLDKGDGENRVPIALVGKAFCLADADAAPIEVGDLLTTSPRSGHAMKATDRLMAVGSVIGKALSALPAARGLIQVLVMAR